MRKGVFEVKCRYDKNQIINILESNPSKEEKDKVIEHIKKCPECERIYNSFYALGKFYEDEDLKVDPALLNSITQRIDKDLYNKNKLKGVVSMFYQHSKIIKASTVFAVLFVIVFLGFSQRSAITNGIVSSSIYRSIMGNPSDKNQDNPYDHKLAATPEKTKLPINTEKPQSGGMLEVFSDLSSFSGFESNFIETNFVKSEEDEYDQLNGWNSKKYSISGSFDVDGDGNEDDIFCSLSELNASILKINDLSLKFSVVYPLGGKVNIVDFDVNDIYKEIVVYDNGPSDDPSYRCFRYNGEEIIELGNIYPKLVDGHGKIITKIDSFVAQSIVYSWYEVKEKGLIKHDIDVSSANNKEYKVTSDSTAYFDEMENVPADFYMQSFEPEIQFELKKDDRITIKYIHLSDNNPIWYFVELGNGKKGILYFWLGD